MMEFLLSVSLLTWPFGQLLAFSLPGTSLTIYLLDIAVGGLSLYLFTHTPTRSKILGDPLFRPLSIFVSIAFISLIFNTHLFVKPGSLTSLLYFVRLLVYPSIYFAVKNFFSPRIYKTILISFLLFCVLGAVQYLLMPDMRFLKYLGFDDHYYRLIGTFFDPNFTGLILAAGTLSLLANRQYPLSIITTILLALTFSRASYLSFLVGVIYLAFSHKQFKLLLLLTLLGVSIYLIPKPFGEGVNLLRTFSIFSRLESWRAGFNLFTEKPLLGWGFNTLNNLSGSRYQIDNSFLFVLATTGLFGFLAFLNFLKASFRQASLVKKAVLLAIVTHSLFNNSFFYIWINFYFWMLLALP